MTAPQTTQPTRTSTILASVIGGGLIGLYFMGESALWVPTALGIGGVVCLTLCLYLARNGTGPREGFVLSLLTVPVGLGFVGGIVWSTIVLVGEQFPVPAEPAISLALLTIIGGLSIIVGCTIAVFGLSIGYRNVLSEASLTQYLHTAFVTASVPVVVGLFLFVRVAVGGGRSAATESAFGELVDQVLTALFSPGSGGIHLASFLFVLTVTGGALVVFLRRVPVVDLLASNGNLSAPRRAARLQQRINIAVTVTALLFVVAMLTEVALSARELEQLLGTGLYEFIQLITTAGWLRTLMTLVAVLTLGWLAIEFLLRQWANWSNPEKDQLVAPLIAGGLVTVGAWITADAVFERLLNETTERLPAVLAARAQDAILPIARVYDETAIIILLAGVLVALTGWIGLVCWAAVHFDYLSETGGGFSVASGGLLVATVGMAFREPPVWLVLAGIVASLAVWDIGRFGTQLGREVGHTGTRAVELVHASSTIAVGTLGVVGALLLESRATSTFDPSPTVTLALVCLVLGLVAFALALRDSRPFG